LACEAVGGAEHQALPGVTALACLQISIVLIDDLLDADPRGMHVHLGEAPTANLATAFQALAGEAITESALSGAIQNASLTCLHRAATVTAIGQHLDALGVSDEAGYWRLIDAKSAHFFGAAFEIGALCADATPETVGQLVTLGRLYGEMTQLHDDLGDCLAVPANPDWRLNRSPLPILFAELVEHPERDRFKALRPTVGEPAALAEAQAILIRSGAISYGLDQIIRRHQQATHLLQSMPLVQPSGLAAMLEAMVAPINELWQSVTGAPAPDWETALVSSV
jgi:geranylgeranyl pyrophosphate synthase